MNPNALAHFKGPKDLYRRLDGLVSRAHERVRGPALVETIAAALLEDFGSELGLLAVHVFAPDGQAARRVMSAGGGPAGPGNGPSTPAPTDLGALEAGVRMGASAAAPSARMVVDAHRARRVLDFELRPGAEQETELVLNTVYSILAVRLLAERLGSTVQEAVEIQKSLLPERVPPFPDFEIALHSVAADLVGGDCYDFLDFGGGTLGIAIGDASGHGLPAALLVRDVVVGLRMGLEKELKPEHALEKLNRVIHASTLSSSFVSLFYAELEQNGNLFYYNAGHEPPLLFASGASAALARGGTVLGPLPEMRPKRHFAHVDRGATLVLYTDGLIERKDARGELFGLERLERTLAERITEPPQSLVDAVFAAVSAHGEGAPWDDDATLLVVRRAP